LTADLITQSWLEALGYSSAEGGLHRRSTQVPANHSYRNEITELLDENGDILATAVFDVEGVPTVCFIEDDGRYISDSPALNRILEKIWNQNLISIVLVADSQNIRAMPIIHQNSEDKLIPFPEAKKTGPFSSRDIQSGEVFLRYPKWFSPENRVDFCLLRNLSCIVQDLKKFGLEKADAQYLMAQVLFISYLEHREIIGEVYRRKHNLKRLEDLVHQRDANGVNELLKHLKHDFNGDFLESDTEASTLWSNLPEKAFSRVDKFLRREDLETRQQSIWPYDFRYIPVELISGIYESFLSEEKRDIGAYYTPRHLANFVVSRVFADSQDILAERVYDGACGSGILLTTAYRRMLSYAEATAGSPLGFLDRCKLLEEHIYGSDINVSACRVTAFSLYLSMLEGLQPTDIAELQNNENIKLPSLYNKNITGGVEFGDFFSEKNPHATSGDFTVFLSNPPWVEPEKEKLLSSDQWARHNNVQIPRRQVAAAFMLRARDSLVPNGRSCMILPISVIAARTSSKFFRDWIEKYQVKEIINFGDLRKIMFNNAKQPCVVVTAKPRSEFSQEQIPHVETFEYWVPKADVSFAFGRLTLHSSDRHQLSTQSVYQDNGLFTTLFWGTKYDVAIITSLRLHGALDEIVGRNGPWCIRKGFHKKDKSIAEPVSADDIRAMPYLDAKRFNSDIPLMLNPEILSGFPDDIKTVSRLPNDLINIFKSPKIIFTDGMTSQRTIRAAFSDKTFSFSHSIGVISGPTKDEELLRFVSIYLRSRLVQYVLLLTAYQINFERERVTINDIQQLPFIHPDQHTNKERAWEIIHTVCQYTFDIENKLQQPGGWFGNRFKHISMESESLIFEYFGLDKIQQTRVFEVADEIAPNLQPNSVLGLNTSLQKRPEESILRKYANGLRQAIYSWREARGGVGDVKIAINVNSENICGPLGIVRVEPINSKQYEDLELDKPEQDDQVIASLLELLDQKKLLPLEIQDNLYLAMDVVIRKEEIIYLVKPLVARFWLLSDAYRDAERIVLRVLATENREKLLEA